MSNSVSKAADHRPSEVRLEKAVPPRTLAEVVPNYGKPWWKVPHLARLNLALTIPALTSYVSGFDGSMLGGMQAVPAWNEAFNYPSGSTLGLVSTMQLIGMVVALPVAPYTTDRFGRRHTIFYGSIILMIGAAVQAAANGMGMFLAGRALVGLGGGCVATAAAPLLAELAYPTQRPIITALYNTTWYLGSIVAAWVTYGTFRMASSWSWRIPSLLQAAPSLIQAVFIYFVPESPRWLIANDRSEEAEQILCKYHAGKSQPDDFIRWEMNEITTAIKNEEAQKSASYRHFFNSAGNRHRFLICVLMGFIIQWCGNGLVTTYLVPVLNSIGIKSAETQNLINGILQIFNYITAITAAFVVDRFGRRLLLLVSTSGMIMAFIIWTAVSSQNEQQNFKNKGMGIGVVVMIFVFFFFYNIAMNPVPVTYLLEILPFTLRAKGMTVFNAAQFSGSIFNGFANPVILEAIGWKYYIVFVCLLVCWFVLIWIFFPETKGLTLEEVSVIFDGEKAANFIPQENKKEDD